jgi:hypothetical protein
MMARLDRGERDLDRVPIEEMLRSRSIAFLECAISLMLVEMTDEEVAQILRASAHDLEPPSE